MDNIINFTAGVAVGVIGMLIVLKILIIRENHIKASTAKIEVGDTGWYTQKNMLYECRVVEIEQYNLQVHLISHSMRGTQDIRIARSDFKLKEE